VSLDTSIDMPGHLPPFSIDIVLRRGFTEPAVRAGRSIFGLAMSLVRTDRTLRAALRTTTADP
jgi:hypothetical protein